MPAPLLRNDLLEYAAPRRRTVRVLWIDPTGTVAWLFDMDGKGCDVVPARIPMLEADLAAGRARRLDDDPWLVVADAAAVKPGHVALRDRAWRIVAELTRDEPAIYEAKRRGQLIAEYTTRHGVSHPTIYRYLRRYWQRGQTPNALLPDYANSGARGKTRASTAGVKRGRPRREGAPPGVNVDDALRRVFRAAAGSHAGGRFSRRATYEAMLRDFFCVRAVVPETLHVVRGAVSDAIPSFGQFSYWLDQGGMLRPPRRPLPLPASAAVAVPGRPGAVFQMTAVRADVQLLARDRSRLAGRPVVYLVHDTYSGMVAGVHVSLDAPGWDQAVLALAHCAADKTRWALRQGRALAAHDWPCRHLPERLLVPSSLAGGDGGAALLHNFGVRCTIAPAGVPVSVSAQQASIPAHAALERRFPLLRLEAPALSNNLGPLDGALDLAQFTRLVHDSVVEHNLQGDGTGPAPLQLWDWGVRERGAAFKAFSEDVVRCALLPLHDALVTEDGICVAGTYFTCPKAVDERWFERARQRGAWAVRVAVDSTDPDCVYLPDPSAPLRFHACHLAPRSAPAAPAASIPAAFLLADDARLRPRRPEQHSSFARIVAGFAG